MNFHSMPDNSRVWIYQSNRALNDFEVSEITKMAQHFVPSWDAHGETLASNISVYYNLFIVITVDESVTRVSGCAIDKSVGFIKRIEQQFNIHLFDRMTIAFKPDQSIATCSIHEFQQLINEGKVNNQTLVFNNLVGTKKEFESNWLTPLEKSWHQRMLSMSAI
jgi:hypothetical protein